MVVVANTALLSYIISLSLYTHTVADMLQASVSCFNFQFPFYSAAEMSKNVKKKLSFLKTGQGVLWCTVLIEAAVLYKKHYFEGLWFLGVCALV